MTIFFGKKKSSKKIINALDPSVLSFALSTKYLNLAVLSIDRFNKDNDYKYWSDVACTSKSPLANPLLKEIAFTLYCIETINNSNSSVKIYGLNPAQEKVILDFYGRATFFLDLKVSVYLNFFRAISLLKFSILIFYAMVFWQFKKTKLINKNDVGILTYFDRPVLNHSDDSYFGDLINHFHARNFKATYLGIVYFPYFPYFKKTANTIHVNAFSRVWDHLYVFGKSFELLFKKFHPCKLPAFSGIIDFSYLYKYNFITGASNDYWQTLLIKRAIQNFFKSNSLKKFIYPFENKTIEKAILKSIPRCVKTIGYQHSSITNNHFGMKINQDEITLGLLPDEIITCGSVTYNWLIENSNIPFGKLRIGCGLRQQKNPIFNGRVKNLCKSKNILFAFSSSFQELLIGVDYIFNQIKKNEDLKFRIRTHPNFPISGLSENYQKKISSVGVAVSNVTLIDDFEWADTVLYISSTVGIDALRCGLPVICLSYDNMSQDPLMGGDIPNRFIVNTTDSLGNILRKIEGNQMLRVNRSKMGSEYALMYFKEISDDNLKYFYE